MGDGCSKLGSKIAAKFFGRGSADVPWTRLELRTAGQEPRPLSSGSKADALYLALGEDTTAGRYVAVQVTVSVDDRTFKYLLAYRRVTGDGGNAEEFDVRMESYYQSVHTPGDETVFRMGAFPESASLAALKEAVACMKTGAALPAAWQRDGA